MKRIYFFTFLITIMGVNGALAEDIRFVYSDEELAPFAMGSGEKQPNPPGIYVELINQVAQELGITVAYTRLPVKRAQSSLENGEFDGYFSLSYKPERLTLGQYPVKNGLVDSNKRIGKVSYYLYKLKKNKISWDGKSLKNVTNEIGANLGYSIAEEIRKMGYTVSEVKTTSANLKKLQSGRICAFAGQNIDTDTLIKTGKFGKIIKVEPPLISKDYYLIFSNQYMSKKPDIAVKFWSKLGEIRDRQTKKLAPKYVEKR